MLAVRDTAAGERAAQKIGSAWPAAALEVRELDLASLESVRAFAAKLTADHPSLDLLVNNAGLVLLGRRRTTGDGFELHLGTAVPGVRLRQRSQQMARGHRGNQREGMRHGARFLALQTHQARPGSCYQL